MKSQKKNESNNISLENLAGIFQTLSEGVALNEMIFNDRMEMTDYRILLVNDAFYDHANIPVDTQVTGMLASRLYRMDQSTIQAFWENHKNDTKPVTTDMTGPIDGKKYRITISPFRDGTFVTSFQNITEVSLQPEESSGLNRDPVRMFGTQRDISEFKKSELLLRESEKRYHSLFNMSMDAMLFTVPDGRILAANTAACKMFGRTEEEMTTIGRAGIMDLTDPRLVQALEQRAATGHFSGELSFVRKNGEKFPGEITSSVFTELDGGTRTSMVIRDITARKAAENEIRQLLGEKELILKEVHHRIKNNMNTIYGLLVMQAQSLTDPKARAALEDARNRVHSMTLLYEKLYESTRFTELSIEKYLPSLVREIISNFPDADSVTLETCIEEIVIDAKRLQPLGIIINELLTNIMKYAFAGRTGNTIRVTAETRENRIVFSIEDNGNGMPDSVDFDHSTGFGLVLVRGLSQQLGGSIRIEREKGTRIVLEFPI